MEHSLNSEVLKLIHASLDKFGSVWYRRKGWNEEWIPTKEPILDFDMFEYKSAGDNNDNDSQS